MTRTILLGALGLVLAVVVGLGVHALTRDTTSFPVVRLDEPPPAPPALTDTAEGTTTGDLPTEPETEGETATETEAETETDHDSSGSGRGRNRGRGDGDD